jgi:hypothetical protein
LFFYSKSRSIGNGVQANTTLHPLYKRFNKFCWTLLSEQNEKNQFDCLQLAELRHSKFGRVCIGIDGGFQFGMPGWFELESVVGLIEIYTRSTLKKIAVSFDKLLNKI